MKFTSLVYFKESQNLANQYITSLSQDLMPAYLSTNNTGEGIVVYEGNAAFTVHFTFKDTTKVFSIFTGQKSL